MQLERVKTRLSKSKLRQLTGNAHTYDRYNFERLPLTVSASKRSSGFNLRKSVLVRILLVYSSRTHKKLDSNRCHQCAKQNNANCLDSSTALFNISFRFLVSTNPDLLRDTYTHSVSLPSKQSPSLRLKRPSPSTFSSAKPPQT
jgi:hypothetical protein